MAKPKSAPTETQNKMAALRVTLDKARDAHKAKPDDKLAKTIEGHEAELKSLRLQDNRERFVRVVGERVRKTRAMIRALGQGANPTSYKYDASDISKMISALTTEVSAIEKRYTVSLTAGASASKVEDDFTF